MAIGVHRPGDRRGDCDRDRPLPKTARQGALAAVAGEGAAAHRRRHIGIRRRHARDRGYGFGVAGLIVIILTGPYIAIDSRDLLQDNIAILIALVPVMFAVSLSRFDMIGTVVFVLLAVG